MRYIREKRPKVEDYFRLCARGFARAVSTGVTAKAVTAFRPLYGALMDTRSHDCLTAEVEILSGHPVPPLPDVGTIVIASRSVTPWKLQLVDRLPAHVSPGVLPVSGTLVAYVNLVPEPGRADIAKEMVRLWERRQTDILRNTSGGVVDSVRKSGFEVEATGSWPIESANTFWNQPRDEPEWIGTTRAAPSPENTPKRARRAKPKTSTDDDLFGI